MIQAFYMDAGERGDNDVGGCRIGIKLLEFLGLGFRHRYPRLFIVPLFLDRESRSDLMSVSDGKVDIFREAGYLGHGPSGLPIVPHRQTPELRTFENRYAEHPSRQGRRN